MIFIQFKNCIYDLFYFFKILNLFLCYDTTILYFYYLLFKWVHKKKKGHKKRLLIYKFNNLSFNKIFQVIFH